MKNIFLLLLIAVSSQIAAQNSDYLITPKGIGPFSLGIKKAEVEKLLGKKITLKNLLKEDGWQDTIKARYKNTDIDIYLQRSYENTDKPDIILGGVRVYSNVYKTQSGITIGDDKMKVVNTYEYNAVNIWPEYEDDEFTRRSKSKAVISVYFDKEGNSISFNLTNKKVTSIEVTFLEEGD